MVLSVPGCIQSAGCPRVVAEDMVFLVQIGFLFFVAFYYGLRTVSTRLLIAKCLLSSWCLSAELFTALLCDAL